MREIAEAIGDRLGMPVKSITPGEASEYFGALAQLATLDLAASGELTRRKLAWTPSGPSLLADLSIRGNGGEFLSHGGIQR
jgi:hypothetical protein